MPGAPPKVLHVFGSLAAIEAEYAEPATLNEATHGVLLFIENRDVYANIAQRQASYDGMNGVDPKGLFPQRRSRPSGWQFRASLPVRFRGGGAPYEGAVVPPWDVYMQMAGFDAATSAFKRTYTPTAPGTGYKSATVGLYTRGGELWGGYGCLANLSMAFQGEAPPVWTFDTMGILDDQPDDAALPSITYPAASLQEVLASGASLIIGDWNPAAGLKGGSFNSNRSVDNQRRDLTEAGGFLGFVPGGWDPELRVIVEATALQASPFHTANGLDAYRLQDAATSLGISLAFGAADTDGSHVKISTTTAQLVDVVPANEGPTATWELVFKPYGNNLKIECESLDESS